MSQPIQILGIAGSLRRASYNRAALRAAMQWVHLPKLSNARHEKILWFRSGEIR